MIIGQGFEIYSRSSMDGIGSIGPMGGHGSIGPIGGLGSMGKIPISGFLLYTLPAHSITHTHINVFILQYKKVPIRCVLTWWPRFERRADEVPFSEVTINAPGRNVQQNDETEQQACSHCQVSVLHGMKISGVQ